MPFTPAQIKVFANAGPRTEHLDSQGGGYITRTFYVEPYIAYPYAETILKGTIVNTGGAVWGRVPPHADPLKPWFRCSDVKVVAFSDEAITGMPVAPFTPSVDYSIQPTPAVGSQQDAINGVLDCVDDHSYGNIVDFANVPPLTPAQTAAGGIQYPNDGTSTGKCGAYLVCTYTPLIFLPGISGAGAPPYPEWDFVNPKWEEEVVSEHTGNSLFVLNPSVWRAAFGALGLLDGGGLSDTFGKPEAIWHVSIKRMMVPFLPKITIGMLNAHINGMTAAIGNLRFPPGTLAFEKMENEIVMGPDVAAVGGTACKTWYNITLRFKVRMLWDEYYETGNIGEDPSYGWIDWNHHYARPCNRVVQIQSGPAAYLPVGWRGGLFQVFGQWHNLYLNDSDVPNAPPGLTPQIMYTAAGGAGNFIGDITVDPFVNGFQDFQ